MLWKAILFTTVSLFLSSTDESDTSGMQTVPLLQNVSSGLTLFLSGDVMTGRGIDQILPYSVNPRLHESYVKNAKEYVILAESQNGPINEPVSWDYIWGDALDVWQQIAPAVKIINLETSITDNGEPWPGKGIHYRMHPKNVKVFTKARINVASLANNHILDWGRSGLSETLKALEKEGILNAGAGRNAEEAREPVILPTDKGRVIVLGFGLGSSGIPDSWEATAEQSGLNLLSSVSEEAVNSIKIQIQLVKQKGDIVVFSIHWGSNWGYDIPVRQREFAHQLIDEAGVDIVHGHSSHHPRGIEVYKGKLILYGAGDFINDYEGITGYEQYRDDLSLMYFPEVDPASGKLISMKMIPMQIRNLQLHHASSSDAEWMQEVLNRESRKFNTSVSLNEDGTLFLSL